jgi:hypothetical protein
MKRLPGEWMLTMLVLMQLTGLGQARTDSLLHELTTAIARAPEYDEAKLQRIGRLQSLLQKDTIGEGQVGTATGEGQRAQ